MQFNTLFPWGMLSLRGVQQCINLFRVHVCNSAEILNFGKSKMHNPEPAKKVQHAQFDHAIQELPQWFQYYNT